MINKRKEVSSFGLQIVGNGFIINENPNTNKCSPDNVEDVKVFNTKKQLYKYIEDNL